MLPTNGAHPLRNPLAVGSNQNDATYLERAMGFEPTTTCLGSKDSTTELRPLIPCLIAGSLLFIQ